MEYACDGSCIIFDRPNQTVKLVFQISYLILQKSTEISTAQLVFRLQNYIIWKKKFDTERDAELIVFDLEDNTVMSYCM